MHASIGILMLETRFPRIFGDAGNPSTWPFPVRIRVVPQATPARVVRGRAVGLLEAFIDAGLALAAEGVAGITTTCGFLCLHQCRIARALPVPFASSSLLQVPLAARLLPAGRRVGILTIDAASLTAAHLRAVGIDAATPLAGLAPSSALSRVLLEDRPSLDVRAALEAMLDAGRQLVADRPDVGCIVLECANMAPYSRPLADELGVPVYDWYSMVQWFAQGLSPRAFLAPAVLMQSGDAANH